MRRRSKIRWSASDEEAFTKAVNNFNAKRRRLKAKYDNVEDPEERKKLLGSLPPTAKKHDLRNEIETRTDFKNEIASLKRFTEKGAEELVRVPIAKDNIYITKYQLSEMKRLERKTEAELSRRRKQYLEIEATSGGKGLGYSSDVGMGKAEEHSLKPVKAFVRSQDLPSVMRRFKTLQKMGRHGFWREKDIRYRENYIASLDKFLNGQPGVKKIIDAIRNMEFEDFMLIAKAETGLFEFSYPTEDNIKASLNKLKEIWIDNPKIDELQEARKQKEAKANAEAKARREEARNQKELARREAEMEAILEAEQREQAEREARQQRKVEMLQREFKRKTKAKSYKNVRKRKQKQRKQSRKHNRRR